MTSESKRRAGITSNGMMMGKLADSELEEGEEEPDDADRIEVVLILRGATVVFEEVGVGVGGEVTVVVLVVGLVLDIVGPSSGAGVLGEGVFGAAVVRGTIVVGTGRRSLSVSLGAGAESGALAGVVGAIVGGFRSGVGAPVAIGGRVAVGVGVGVGATVGASVGVTVARVGASVGASVEAPVRV